MSLILDALRKLERDKQPRDPGVVVVGHVPWGGRDPDRRLPRVVLGAAVMFALGLAGLWLLRSEPPSAPPGSPDAAARVDQTVAPLAAAPSEPGALADPPAGSTDTTAPSPPAAPVAPPAPRAIDLPGPGSAPAVSPASVDRGEGTEPSDGDALGATTEPRPAVPAAPVAAPATTTPRPDPRLRLTAISERDGRPVALLNDRLVREGDSFDGVVVLRIGATEVEVEVDGQKRVVGF